MTNKEFINYMILVGKVDPESLGITEFCKYDKYLGDRYIKIEKISRLYSDSILMLFENIIIKIENKQVYEGLDRLIDLIEKYSTYINYKTEKFCLEILKDFIYLGTINMDYFLYKSIIVNPKGMMIDGNMMKIEPVSVQDKMKYGMQYKWLLKLGSHETVDMILCKENRRKFIIFEQGDQLDNIRELLRKEESFDLMLIGYYTASYPKILEHKLKPILGRKGVTS